jgi:hypothetical protein
VTGIEPALSAWESVRFRLLTKVGFALRPARGLAFPLVESFGVGPVNAGTGDAVKDGHGVTWTRAGAGSSGLGEGACEAGLGCGRSPRYLSGGVCGGCAENLGGS